MDSKGDPLLERIKRVTNQVDRAQYDRDKRHALSTVGRIERETVSFQTFFYQLSQTIGGVFRYLVFPLWRPLRSSVTWLLRQYIRLWNLAVHTSDQYGVLRFSKVRAMVFVGATLVFFSLLPMMGDTALYLGTVKHEVVYLNNSQEILPIEGIHSVQGCQRLPCTERESIYFRIRPTVFNEVWSLLHHHTWFFPDYVAAAVPPVVSRCEAITYGVRLKLFVRGFNVYPDLIDVSCQPLIDK